MPQLKEFYHDVDLKANQLFNSRVHNITTASRTTLGASLSTSSKGYMVYDTDLSSPYFWDGTQWKAAGGGGGTWGSITGTITAQTDLVNYIAGLYTPKSRTLTINGTAYDLTANRSWTVGDLLSSGSYSNPSWLTSLAWSKISSTPTTLSGYGITDAVSTSRTLTINGTSYDLSANRTWSVGTVTSVGATGLITSSGGTTPTISTSMASNKLIGRSNAGTGVMEEITVGTGLSLSGGTLNATAQSVGFEQNFLLMGA
jgi:predicted heme/steroid binding protein